MFIIQPSSLITLCKMTSSARVATEWFRSFYVTPYMFDQGIQVLKPIYDLSARQGARPFKLGLPYNFDQEMLNYLIELEEHGKDLAEYKQECADNNEAFDSEDPDTQPPHEPLLPATWSFANGPLKSSERMEQIEKFDDNTLLRIILDYVEPDFSTIKTWSRTNLVTQMSNIIEHEYDAAEMALEYHPILELMSGVLCRENWKYLSSSDLAKWTVAHGGFVWDTPERNHFRQDERANMVATILKEQVKMLEEMVKKRQTGDGADSRGYDRPRSILLDNKQSLNQVFGYQYQVNADDEPDRDKRKKLKQESSSAKSVPRQEDHIDRGQRYFDAYLLEHPELPLTSWVSIVDDDPSTLRVFSTYEDAGDAHRSHSLWFCTPVAARNERV